MRKKVVALCLNFVAIHDVMIHSVSEIRDVILSERKAYAEREEAGVCATEDPTVGIVVLSWMILRDESAHRGRSSFLVLVLIFNEPD